MIAFFEDPSKVKDIKDLFDNLKKQCTAQSDQGVKDAIATTTKQMLNGASQQFNWVRDANIVKMMMADIKKKSIKILKKHVDA